MIDISLVWRHDNTHEIYYIGTRKLNKKRGESFVHMKRKKSFEILNAYCSILYNII